MNNISMMDEYFIIISMIDNEDYKTYYKQFHKLFIKLEVLEYIVVNYPDILEDAIKTLKGGNS